MARVEIVVTASDRASGPLHSVGNAVEGIDRAAGRAGSGGLSRLGSALSNLGGVAAGAIGGITAAVGGLAVLGIQANASAEQTAAAFTTLLGSGEAAKGFLDDLRGFAASTPFEFPELADAAKKLLAFGFAAEDVIPMMTAIGDAVGALGGGQAEIDRVTMALGQMQAKGKVSAEEMNQLAELGIPAWKMLADSMGITTAEAMKLAEQGLIPADAAVQSLLAGMEQTFGGAMAAQATTFNGLLSTLKDNAMMALMAFSGPLFETAKGALTQLGTAVSSPALQQFASVLGQQVGAAIVAVAGFLASAIPAVQGFLAAMTAAGSGGGAVMQTLGSIVQSTLTIMGALWQEHGAMILGVVQGAFTAMSGIVQVVLGIMQGTLAIVAGAMTGDWITAMTAIQSANTMIWDGISTLLSGVLQGLAALAGTSLAQLVAVWRSNFDMLPGVVRVVVEQMLAALRAAISRATEIGRAIIDGIKAGVASAAKGLADAAASAAKAALDAAKRALGIRSPSAAFRDQVGLPMMQGMREGIQAGTAIVQQAIDSSLKASVQAVGEQARTAGIDLGSAVSRGVGSGFNLRDALSGGLNGALGGGGSGSGINLNDLLGRSGGGGNLRDAFGRNAAASGPSIGTLNATFNLSSVGMDADRMATRTVSLLTSNLEARR